MPIIILSIFVMAMLFLQTYSYKRLWDKGLTFRTRFSAKEAFEGDTLYLREELVNKKLLPLPWVNTRTVLPPEFTFLNKQDNPVPPEGKGSSLFAIMMYTAIRRKHKFICTKRGLYNLREARIYAGNLLHTQQFDKEVFLRGELLVFPKILDSCDDVALIFKQLDSAILSKKIIDPDPFEFRGVRDYQPTDALKTINFKASAISQKLMVNVHAPTSAQKLTLVLNLDSLGPWIDSEIYEQSIRLTATLAQHYIQQGANLSFTTNGRDCITAVPMSVNGGTSDGHLYKIFECLARVSLSYRRAPMTNYVEQITDREQVYLFVSPYHGDEFMSAFEELNQKGISAHMIVPVIDKMRESITETDDVMVWNAGAGR
ncbi:MAG: DUF58 domain-containing protein [Firmicutes bacterium]|nr:DUF58 domain-containing protein [Bacillota bacterium]